MEKKRFKISVISNWLAAACFFSFHAAFAGMTVNPGAPKTVCKGDSVTLGGSPTASGGVAPYTYSWTPTAGMNYPDSANPTVLITKTTLFVVTVVDSTGARVIDSVLITLNPVFTSTAGNDTSLCPNTAGATLGKGNNPSYIYSWTPLGSGLSCYNCPQPVATPSATTTYSLTVNNGGCIDSLHVTVTMLTQPVIIVTPTVVIDEGQEATLNASGAVNYFWTPDTDIFNQNSANPQVSPNTSMFYDVVGIGADGCPGFNQVWVEVKTDSNLVFYNTFTPNGDGINDFWYVGNLSLYPNNELTIFNRYGKQVYFAQPYLNNWNGSSLGTDLPDATYYYVLSTGTGKSYSGSITIIRKPK